VLLQWLCLRAGTEAALVLGSGMAAITSTLLTLLKAGDHMLIQVRGAAVLVLGHYAMQYIIGSACTVMVGCV
jgi:cystathionine beta-lyase/cystathionine gamma-synthase